MPHRSAAAVAAIMIISVFVFAACANESSNGAGGAGGSNVTASGGSAAGGAKPSSSSSSSSTSTSSSTSSSSSSSGSSGSSSASSSSSSSTSGASMACVPNKSDFCACPNNMVGSQTCNAQGTGYTAPCDCMSAMQCIPGMSDACVGPGACQGGQVCNAQGTGFGPCVCSSSSSSSSGGTSSGAPPPGTDTYEICYYGDPPGSWVSDRYIDGYPVAKNDHHWDDCSLSCGGANSCANCTPVKSYAPWQGLGDDHEWSNQPLCIYTVIPTGMDIRFETYDYNNGINYGCYSNIAYQAAWKNGTPIGLVQVENGEGGLNCQTVSP